MQLNKPGDEGFPLAGAGLDVAPYLGLVAHRAVPLIDGADRGALNAGGEAFGHQGLGQARCARLIGQGGLHPCDLLGHLASSVLNAERKARTCLGSTLFHHQNGVRTVAMSDTNGHEQTPPHAEPQNDAAEAAPDPAAEPIPEHLTDAALDGAQLKHLAEERITELQAEIDAQKEQVLRLAAELENTRRRADREKQDAAKYGITNFARDLLSVADNFARAIETTPEDPAQLDADGLKGLVNGIRMTEKELLTVFERHGITKLDPKGEKFDPNIHQAIAQVPGNGVDKDHVVDVAAPGFTIGDRVIRAAMVTVSTG